MGTICALHCVHHQLMWVRIILYASPTCIHQRTLSSLHRDVCIIGPALWQLHCVISTISFMYKIFRYCIAPALQSYISRMHHSHGHRAYASRIILFKLINSFSKNVLEQKLSLISFLSRFTTRLRHWFFQNLDSRCKEWSPGAFSVEKQLISSHNHTVIPLAYKLIHCFLNFL